MEREELEALTASNVSRVEKLIKRGVQLQGLEAHYLVSLLEVLAGPQLVAVAKEAHEEWVSVTLDDVDARLRMNELLRV